MFGKNTVFVIGAGAGIDADMPTGNGLIEKIHRHCDLTFDRYNPRPTKGNVDIFETFLKDGSNGFEYRKAASTIHNGIYSQRSIDGFLETHADKIEIVDYGKRCITYSIVQAERASKIYRCFDQRTRFIDLSALRDTWYVSILNMMCSGVRADNYESIFNNLSFIVFNYDRCLEFFLYYGLKQALDLSDDHASSIIKNANIIHPYGMVGNLPEIKNNTRQVHFGSINHGHEQKYDIESISSMIRIYTEKQEEDALTKNIKDTVCDCDQLVFLGFGFHDQNIKILTPDRQSKISDIYATAFKIENESISAIKSNIESKFRGPESNSGFQYMEFRSFNEECRPFLNRIGPIIAK